MKKSTFLKVALVAVAMFMFAGANAQILTDYENIAEDIYQTEGKTFRVYVMPDLVYSPTYVAATNANLGAAARWTWTYPAGLTTGAPASGVTLGVPQNWVEFTNPVVGGPFALEVVESTTIGLGCTDADAETRNVYIIAAPVATITTADPAQACGDQAAVPVAMTFTEAVPSTWASYAFAVTEVVDRIDDMGNLIANVTTNNTYINFPTASKLKSTSPIVAPMQTALTGAASPYGFTFNTSDLDVAQVLGVGYRTRYTYTLVKTPLVAGADGLVSAISQKSDRIGGTVLTHVFGAKTTFVAIVNPTPVTGPIYHIPNDFAY